MKNRVYFIVGCMLFMAAAMVERVAAQNQAVAITQQKYFPQYHFRPLQGWIGDPDGLVYTDSTFHLFWWGHATSKDLVHWQEQPHPMKGDDGSFSYFSGSVAVDHDNTSGFGHKSMIAVFTRHFAGDSLPETQVLSISTDGGQVFNYYKDNPVLDIKKIFFRDPQVFWYEPAKLWKMVVTVPDIQQIHIYESKDLKSWTFCSKFEGLGAKNSFWECPDLFELPVIGTKQKKWVLLIGRGPNRVQYFVGNFDGKKFTPDTKTAEYLKTGKGLHATLFENFENGLTKWKVEGNAFAINTSEAVDNLGSGYAGTSTKASSTGKLISPKFTIKNNAINFLLAGGKHRDSTCINLVVNSKVVRATTGDNTKVFKWNGWDVRDLKGKKAHIEIVDKNGGANNAFIAVDHVIFSDKLMNQQLEHTTWLDYGPDYYATRTWRNYDKNRSFGDTVFAISWMGNWDYAGKIPSTWGKGFESVPRIMALKQTEAGYRVVQQPISALKQFRSKPYQVERLKVSGTKKLGFQPERNSYELEAELKPTANSVFGLNLLVGDGRKLVLRYDPTISQITLDRTNCTDHTSDAEFTKLFAKKYSAPLSLQNGILKLHIFVDQSSIEIFTNDGEVVLSAVTYPSENQTGIELFVENGETMLNKLTAWGLNSIWK
ncbi:hypothetical protein EOD41_13135 [Mucilaginibacter limnophilus]|uniref:Glycoside hydrolase family 32 protein n=1 Tax=Mucilaginibacter limnophilus TaxID=1932778 RepID=A0A3S2V146_9SPHI|nr:GH32 C-terminal domain-containing protein [Mucilaginibacter limnophilus]RVU00417.1 hypothetical protein EOD41_13135 [Mucilaginibacter limnophilus]